MALKSSWDQDDCHGLSKFKNSYCRGWHNFNFFWSWEWVVNGGGILNVLMEGLQVRGLVAGIRIKKETEVVLKLEMEAERRGR